MVCVYCNSPTKVVNSRHQKRSNSTWRRRKCLVCSAIVSSVESIDLQTCIQFSQNKHTTPFIREKLFISVYESCRHRPTALIDAIGLTTTIIAKSLEHPNSLGTITRTDLISTTYATLKKFDSVAATYYAAYHKD
jgi:transcriptional regulator NrdR family protein